jgi:hypothetical protein
MEKRKFTRDEIEAVLREVSAALERRCEAYIIGGLAMMHHGAKLATKDIDIVFRERRQTLDFVRNLQRIGFADVSARRARRGNLRTGWILARPDAMRFDIFDREVCDCLALSDAMAARSVPKALPGNLALRVISPEDIFLLKSVTARDDDLADMAQIARKGLDWMAIEHELRAQPAFWNWVAHRYVKLTELEERYAVRSPLKRRFRKDAELAAGMACLAYELEKRPLSVREASVALKERSDRFGRAVLEKMVELGTVRKAGDKYRFKKKR